MTEKGWWSEAQDKALVLECRQQVRDALAKAEKQLKPSVVHLFTDVYGIFNFTNSSRSQYSQIHDFGLLVLANFSFHAYRQAKSRNHKASRKSNSWAWEFFGARQWLFFDKTTDTVPPNLQEQKAELEQHLKKYPDEYPTDLHSRSL